MRTWTGTRTIDRARPLGLARSAAIALSATLGLFLIWGVGFAGPQSIHDATHDARHSIAFPCH